MPYDWEIIDESQILYEVVRITGPNGYERMGVMPMAESDHKPRTSGTNVFKNLSRENAQELADIFNEAYDDCCYYHVGDEAEGEDE